MSLKEQIDQDLKAALLGGNKILVTTLRGLKSALLNVEIETGQRETGLTDKDVVNVLRKEAKKRQESAELYEKAGDQGRAQAERSELETIEKYLPAQVSDEFLEQAVSRALEEIGESSMSAMGKIIARTKELVGDGADGGRIAAKVKEKVGS